MKSEIIFKGFMKKIQEIKKEYKEKLNIVKDKIESDETLSEYHQYIIKFFLKRLLNKI